MKKRRALPRVIAHSTIPVRTEKLREKGVDEIRVLSESRFLHVVRKLVEDAVARRLAAVLPPAKKESEDTEVIVLEESLDALRKALDPTADPPPAESRDAEVGAGSNTANTARDASDAKASTPSIPESQAATASAYRERWDELRQRHLETIEAIESRLAHLGKAVLGMEKKLSSPPSPAKGSGEATAE